MRGVPINTFARPISPDGHPMRYPRERPVMRPHTRKRGPWAIVDPTRPSSPMGLIVRAFTTRDEAYDALALWRNADDRKVFVVWDTRDPEPPPFLAWGARLGFKV